MNTRGQNRIILSVIACVFLIFFAVALTSSFTAHADLLMDSGDNASFSTMSKAGADYLSMLKNGTIKGLGITDAPEPKDQWAAGGLMGYPSDPESFFKDDFSENNTPWFSFNSNGAGSYQYARLKEAGEAPYINYAKFGKVMYALGLDQTSANAFDSGYRTVIGCVFTALYFMTNFVAEFWYLVLNVLELLNPFVLFSGDSIDLSGFSAIDGKSLGTDIGGSMEQGVNAIRGLVAGFYSTLVDMSKTLFLPLFLVLGVFIWLVIKKGKEGTSTLRNLAVRIVFVAIGLPLMLSCYTTALSIVKDMTVTSCKTADDVVTTTFFDFDRQAHDAFSKAYNKVIGNIDDDFNVTGFNKIKSICSDLNDIAVSSDGKLGGDEYVDALETKVITDFDIDSDEGINKYNKAVLDGLFDKDSDSGIDKDHMAQVLNLLNRYRTGEKVSAAKLSIAFITSDAVMREDPDTGAGVNIMPLIYAVSSRWEYFVPDYTNRFRYKDATIGGSFDSSMSSAVAMRFDPPSASSGSLLGGGVVGVGEGLRKLWAQSDSGFSVMSLYNYLSSSFDDTQIRVYSSSEVNANMQKVEHYSVTAPGSEVTRVVLLVNSAVLLLTMCVIGYCYGAGLIFANFRAMIKIVPAVFIGTLGSMRGIASALILVAALISEVLGTCAIYDIAVYMVASLSDLICGPVCHIFASVGDTWGLATVVSGIVSIIVMLFILKEALEYRYAVCRAITEGASSIINKFLGTSVNAPDIGANPTAKGLAAVGAATATAGRVMSAAGTNQQEVASVADKMANISGRDKDREALADEIEAQKAAENANKDAKKDETTGALTFESDRAAEAYIEDNIPENMDLDAARHRGEKMMKEEKEAKAAAEKAKKEKAAAEGKSKKGTKGQSGKKAKSGSDEQGSADSANVADNNGYTGSADGSSGYIDNSNADVGVSGDVVAVSGSADNVVDNSADIPETIVGPDGREYEMRKSDGSKYTKGDHAAGESYSLVDKATNEPFVDDNGVIYENMPASTAQLSLSGGVDSSDSSSGGMVSRGANTSGGKGSSKSLNTNSMSSGDSRAAGGDAGSSSDQVVANTTVSGQSGVSQNGQSGAKVSPLGFAGGRESSMQGQSEETIIVAGGRPSGGHVGGSNMQQAGQFMMAAGGGIIIGSTIAAAANSGGGSHTAVPAFVADGGSDDAAVYSGSGGQATVTQSISAGSDHGGAAYVAPTSYSGVSGNASDYGGVDYVNVPNGSAGVRGTAYTANVSDLSGSPSVEAPVYDTARQTAQGGDYTSFSTSGTDGLRVAGGTTGYAARAVSDEIGSINESDLGSADIPDSAGVRGSIGAKQNGSVFTASDETVEPSDTGSFDGLSTISSEGTLESEFDDNQNFGNLNGLSGYGGLGSIDEGLSDTGFDDDSDDESSFEESGSDEEDNDDNEG